MARALIVSLVLLLAPHEGAAAQARGCDVSPFPLAVVGPVALTMRVVNDGQPCGFTNYGSPAEMRNPATDGVITQAPRHGKAHFLGARVEYTPDPGYVGDDTFAYRAHALSATGRPVVLMVFTAVIVSAPR
jgi:hypothetical protein